MGDEIIIANVYSYGKGELQATLQDGTNIAIDPFVTGSFDWEHADKLIGTWKFEGFWYENNCFIANEIHSLLQDWRKGK